MDPKLIAGGLLLIRFVAAFFFARVLIIQVQLLRSPERPELHKFRVRLLIFTLIGLAGQVYPIFIDVYGVLGMATEVMVILYAFSNATTALFMATALWQIYNLAIKEDQDT